MPPPFFLPYLTSEFEALYEFVDFPFDTDLLGTLRNDQLFGSDSFQERIRGLAGNDTLQGFGGFVDLLFGGDGRDFLVSNASFASLYGGNGADTLVGNGDWNFLSGGSGNDVLIGRGEANQHRGGAGADVIRCGQGDDTLFYDSADVSWGSISATRADTVIGFDNEGDVIGALIPAEPEGELSDYLSSGHVIDPEGTVRNKAALSNWSLVLDAASQLAESELEFNWSAPGFFAINTDRGAEYAGVYMVKAYAVGGDDTAITADEIALVGIVNGHLTDDAFAVLGMDQH